MTGSSIGFYHFLEADQQTLSLQNWSTNTLQNMCTAEGKGLHYPVEAAGVWADCIRERRPLIHNDYASLSHRKGLPDGHAPVVREVVVPVFRGNLIKAIVGVGNKAGPYEDSDIEVVSELADLSWDIVEHKRTEEVIRRTAEEKTLFSEIAEVFLTTPDEEMYDKVLAIVLRVLESPFGLFGYIAENGDLVLPSLSRSIWNECQVPEKSIVFPPAAWGQSLWGRAIREMRSFRADGPFHTPEGHVPVDHFLAVPILFGGKTIGLISAANRTGGYGERDEELLLRIAAYVAPILNARLERDAQERSRIEAEEQIRLLNAVLEDRVRERTAELVRTNEELEAFSYSVSHDLRAPLRHLTGFVDLLGGRMAGKLDEKERHYLSVIAGSAIEMGHLIDAILSFSQLGRMSLVRARVSMGTLLAEVIEMMRSDLAGRDIVWKIGPLPDVHGSSEMLRTVWTNLVSNAVKFTANQSRAIIEIGHMEHEDGEDLFYIRDNGVGFDMRYVDKLFSLFQRLHRADEFEGTGLGLANVRRIIHRHGGKIWAEGTVGQGAAFYFTLPKTIGG